MLASSVPNGATLPRRPKQLQRLASRLVRSARTVLDRASAQVTADIPLLEASLGRLDRTLSLRHVRARVVAVRAETHDVNTYVLRPNARFGSFRAGSYVTLNLTIDGRKVERAYSLSSAPGDDGLVSITVKRVPGGLVSNYLADTLQRGAVLDLSVPMGQFVLPEQVPDKLLLISAGSGITPVMSQLRHLLRSGSKSEITFLHFARSPDDLIFRDELDSIHSRYPHVRVHLCVERADENWLGATGMFNAALLESAAPDFRTTETFLCGPGGFMKAVMQTLEAGQADMGKLHYERFNVEFDVSAFLGQTQLVRFVRSGVESLSTGPRTILEQAEARGVRVESSCRTGVCGTCRCSKKSGVVVDVTTGEASSDGEGFFYPCVSVARGAVEVVL
ncbi:MAG: hybrid-cluster NAD(P)-dependent oxidoreductase [Myxococcaceae bacterium]|nr:hybrid-cluster NAD(P)-dependent oxidoreductase [Myxococcaceae bacterium]